MKPVFLLLCPALLCAQGGLNPADIFKPHPDQWPTYSGDYSAKRFSELKQINQSTVKNLSLAWVTQFNNGCGPTGTGTGPSGPPTGGGRGALPPAPIIVGGLGA